MKLMHYIEEHKKKGDEVSPQDQNVTKGGPIGLYKVIFTKLLKY